VAACPCRAWRIDSRRFRPAQSSVSAADACKVAYEEGGFGNYIKVQHEGFVTLYAHLYRIIVHTGSRVSFNQVLGFTGSTGFSTGIHLHFGLYPDGEPRLNGFGGAVNPSPYFGEGAAFNPTGTLEYNARPSGNLIAIYTKPSKWFTPAKARKRK
jgi:murein DD-endopeptidase MepM/ murein hydrolase activator NlpD